MPLHNVALTDPLLGITLIGPDSPDPNGQLDPGETWTMARNYHFTAAQVGSTVNDDPTVTALDPSNHPVNASAHFGVLVPV